MELMVLLTVAMGAQGHVAPDPNFWAGTHSNSMRRITSMRWFYDAEPTIQRITAASELQAIKTPLLVEFFAPWCPHCQHFREDFIKSTRQLHTHRPLLTVAAVDCVAQDDLCNQYKIDGFPTVRLFNVRPKPLEYQGKYAAANLVEWVISTVGEGSDIKEDDKKPSKSKARRRVPKREGAVEVGTQAPMPISSSNSQVPELNITEKMNTLATPKSTNIIRKRTRSKRNITNILETRLRVETRNESIIRVSVGHVRMADLISAVVFWLRHNIFIGTDNLQGVRLAALKQILASLQLFFFQACAGTNETSDVAGLFQSLQSIDDSLPEKGIDKTEWLPLLRESGLISNLAWTAQCDTSSSPFTCGLWLLFHSMIGHTQNSEQATAACQAIVAIVRSFFGCDACSQHFLTLVPDLDNHALTPDDAATWLWRAHNSVNLRVDQNERAKTGVSTKMPRPSPIECPTCKTNTPEGWDMSLVAQWLLSTYGPSVCQTAFPNVSLASQTAYPSVTATSLSSSVASQPYVGFFLLLSVVAIAVVFPTCSASIQRSFFTKKRMSPTPLRRQLGQLDV